MKRKLTIIGLFISVILIAFGISYAYFSARIIGNESASTIGLLGGKMRIQYSENTSYIALEDIYPRSESWATKTITLTGTNSTDLDMNYELGIEIENNTFKGGQLTLSLTGEGSNGILIEDIEKKAIVKPNGYMKIGIGTFKKSNEDTHVYTLNIYFKNTGKDQNINQGAVFSGKVTVKDRDAVIADMKNKINTTNQNHTEKYCQTDDYLEGSTPTANQVYEPANSIYKYKYSNGNGGGWTVSLKDATSTNPISEGPCTYVNEKPINNMANLFKDSQAASIDLSNFNTLHVINIAGMFYDSAATTITGLTSFDTSKVTNISGMFWNSKADSLDLSSFDTSNVTDMNSMFYNSAATIIVGLNSFNVSNVTDMASLFYRAAVQEIDLSSFDTSSVINMNAMFRETQITKLDLSSFDTSSVTNMNNMFRSSKVTSLDLSNFDTSKVTYMGYMFYSTRAQILDLNTFDTSNVTDMNSMFRSSQATTIDLSSFNTSNVTNMTRMFNASQATRLDLSNFNTSKVANMEGMFYNCKATIGYAKTQADADRFNNVAGSLSNGEDPDTKIPSTLRFTVK